MRIALALSRLALGMALTALFVLLTGPRWHRPSSRERRTSVMALATLAVGLALFALFFGLVAGCDGL